MRLLDRYLLRELLLPLGYCLAGFLLFWITSDLISQLEEFHEQKLQAMDIAEYYLVRSPEFIVIVLPIALLLALLYTLTQHARHNELAAIRAAGVSLWRLSLPYFGVAAVAGAVMFVLNELWVPDSVENSERIRARYATVRGAAPTAWVEKLGFENSREGRSWLLDYNLGTLEMRNIHVDWRMPDGSRRVFTAQSGVRSNGVWVFFNTQQQTEVTWTNIPMNRSTTKVLAMPEFSETPEQIKSDINISKRLTLRTAKRADIPLVDIVNYLKWHQRLSRTDRYWVYTKLHGRLALPVTCLVIVLIAVPFGAVPGRRNVFVGVAGSIAICFAYFVLLQLGLALGVGGYLPPWLAAWVPNLAFGITGAWLTTRLR